MRADRVIYLVCLVLVVLYYAVLAVYPEPWQVLAAGLVMPWVVLVAYRLKDRVWEDE